MYMAKTLGRNETDPGIDTDIYRNSDGTTFDLSANWRLPYDLLGKKIRFTWDVVRDGTSRYETNVSGLDPTEISVPQAMMQAVPQVSVATLASSQVGKLEVPWFIAANKVTAARYEYQNSDGYTVSVNMPADVNTGTILLDATKPHKNFRIVMSYKDNNNYDISDKSSEVQDMQMVHAPVGLTAFFLGGRKAAVQLDWSIQHADVEDITPVDFFEIQRSLTGKEKDFVTIGTEPYVPDNAKISFSYVDSTIVEAVAEEHLKGGGTLDSLTYRIRRMCTQKWDWLGNPACCAALSYIDDLHLLRLQDYTAKWEDQKAYTVRVEWNYLDEYNAVLDNRSKIILRVSSMNRDGIAVDTTLYVLNQDEINARHKIISLRRPCVTYKVEMFVDRGTSPIRLMQDMKSTAFAIKTVEDWDAFVQKVENGEMVYARLYNDITVTKQVGENYRKIFNGVFDGNGHTLTFNSGQWTVDYIAPFRYVGNAYIHDLHVDGTINNSKQYSAGLISKVWENGLAVIERCRVSSTINSSWEGEAFNAGFVSRNEGVLYINNCQFDGSLLGSSCNGNAGFVGWSLSGHKVSISNCYFSPDKLETDLTQCETWARMEKSDDLTLVNSYCTHYYDANANQRKGGIKTEEDGSKYFYIYNDADWVNFVESLEQDSNINAYLLNDITVSKPGSNFSGTFYGNGFTINLNSIYLFFQSTNATFKNLRVAGKTRYNSPSSYVGGIVSLAAIGNTTFERCHASIILDVTQEMVSLNNGYYLGAFAGYIGSSDKVKFVDCLFDGSIPNTEFNHKTFEICGFVCVNSGKIEISRCLFAPSYVNMTNSVGYNWSHTRNYGETTITDSYFTYDLEKRENVNLDQEQLVADWNSKEPNSWQYKDGKAVPILLADVKRDTDDLTTEEILDVLGSNWKAEGDNVMLNLMVKVADVPTPTPAEKGENIPTFYFESIGKIDKTLKTETLQSSVVLTWETNGDPIDYFTVLRCDQDSIGVDGTGKWKVVETNISQMGYEDKTVLPLRDYYYKVRAYNDCEGLSYTETDVVAGACKHTGRVEGYVRLKDGTGVAGIKVNVTTNNNLVCTITTDDNGHFVAEGLSYNNLQSIDYEVSVIGSDGKHYDFEGDNSRGVTFDSLYNNRVVNDIIILGKKFSGYVMYDGTSIPVKGANFKLNGHNVYNNEGTLVETDFDGSFSFSVLPGKDTIQVVMDGHKFVNDGYFKSAGGHEFTDDVANIYFYDATLVKLTGRVVGGKDQGNLPLDNNLSRNNLGENLTMVLSLEGDNTSWLVYDNLNPTLNKRTMTYKHPLGDTHKTVAEVQRKLMVVKPDSATGEYVLMLPPVRWKVQQIYCEGYPTLFQDGMVSEVIDLTDALTPDTINNTGTYVNVDGESIYQPQEIYNYRYDRIYHAPVEITYKQLGYDSFSYFGDKSYMATNAGGERATVPLAFQTADSVGYTFGYPVFSLGRRYPIQISVVERYPWNGKKNSSKEDLVKIGNGRVTIHNGMKNGLHQEELQLDSLGEGVFMLEAEQSTRLLTDKDALHTVTMTLEQDGTNYEAAPLRGYILNMFATTGTFDVLVEGQPLLIDILRDPPGSESTATLSKGSTLKYAYKIDMALKAGLKLTWVSGTSLDNYQGTVIGVGGNGTSMGIINSGDTETALEFEYAFRAEGTRAFDYTMHINEDITTSSDHEMVGADADLYIGTTQNIVVTPMSTIRAIPDSTYQHMVGRLGGGKTGGISTDYGTLVEIAEGRDAEGNKFHLVRDESIGYGPQVTSHFVHSQKHIMTQLIPEKVKQLRDLMFIGTAEEAQRQANLTGKAVYRSLVPADSENFAVLNAKDGEPYYYNSTMPEETGMNYVIHEPAGYQQQTDDEVAKIGQTIYAWTQMIAMNEKEKLSAANVVQNYDVDGGSSVSYSEQFENDYTVTNYYYLPGIISDNYFDTAGGDLGLTVGSMVGVPIVSKLLTGLWEKFDTQVGAKKGEDKNNKEFSSKVSFYGKTFQIRILPVMDYQTKSYTTVGKSYSRKESFNIVMDHHSHLNFDLLYSKTHGDSLASNGILDVYSNENFYDGVDYVQEYISRGSSMPDIQYSRGFVYRTRGGATCNPWEDERHTYFYEQGTTLDERTKKICNPKITLDRQSISGIPVSAPARFKVYLSNDSEMPEAVNGTLRVFKLYLSEKSNPNGAKIYVDGTPLNQSGLSVSLTPGEVVQKTIEVYAGDGFDYEGLEIGLCSDGDWMHSNESAKFDVHYLHMAGDVNIASPSDKWVLNTNAQWNEKRGWFLPITIDGFNKHQHNFDHIEFQYKESLRGEDTWTNLCSFYADSTLLKEANGIREMIPENGNINTQFYGDGVEMERRYDLRAVLYCRNGNSFLTTPSKVLSGIKDTRRPKLFGTPEPKSGILYGGENIVFNFSEDIEYNYLNAITNFEVKGEVNNQDVSEAVSLQFTGQSSLETEAQRNFSGKDLTIDMMVKPADINREMPLFSHGTNDKKLQLWLTIDKKLKAVVNDQEFTSSKAIAKDMFTQVAMVIENNDDDPNTENRLKLFNGGEIIGQFTLERPYNGTGRLIFGRTNEADRSKSQYYEGRMMEARLWYRAMDGGQITTYGHKRLTGFESGLVGYYPMNEGYGEYAIDHTQGANAKITGTSWVMPRGLSLKLKKADRGLALNQNTISRTSKQDYTLMFWFKTDANGQGVLLSNGEGTNEPGAENHIKISFEDSKLMFRSKGIAEEIAGDYANGQWHHYAMTVNRTFNVVNIYVDQTLHTTFAADSLGGISGGTMLVGGLRADADKEENFLEGNIDELCVFEQALPLTLLQAYSTKSPNGDEIGLMTYLSFERQERQKDNDIVLVAYPYSKKIYLDDNGDVVYEKDKETQQPTTTPKRDYSFDENEVSIDKLMAHIDDETAAPIVPYEELKNLNFGFVGEGHKVLVDVNEANARLNRRRIYVTLRDVEDKNGNAMASPVTAAYYVSNSSLVWFENREEVTVPCGKADTLELSFLNVGATHHTYKIENCPKWLKLDKYTDILPSLDYTTVEAIISKDLNVGTYDEIIYLTDEDGISEPLFLTVTVEAEKPDWAWNVSRDLLENSMNIVGRVYLNDDIDIDTKDIVGVFDEENVCHGFANVEYSALTGESGLYLTVYDSQKSGRDLYFKLWQYSTGCELLLTANGQQSLKFKNDTILGTDTPVIFAGGIDYVQTIDLKEGWNWISFNLNSDRFVEMKSLLNGQPWQAGDVFTDMNSTMTLVYDKDGHWLASDKVEDVKISPRSAYAVKVQKDIKFTVPGTIIQEDDERTIQLKQGWNGIGYTPMLNLSVQTALSDYYDQASAGDVIKSHDEFAYFTISRGVGRWRGSLQYMKPGQGYMMLRKGQSNASFLYPFYEPGSTFIDELAVNSSRSSASFTGRNTMTVSAAIEGFEAEQGDMLVVYADGQIVGKTIIASDVNAEQKEPLYLNISGDERTGLWFAIEREGEIVANTGEVMEFRTNAVVGSPDEPTVINFIRMNDEDGHWYNLNGIQLPKRPTKKGVYIFNGRKVVIK